MYIELMALGSKNYYIPGTKVGIKESVVDGVEREERISSYL